MAAETFPSNPSNPLEHPVDGLSQDESSFLESLYYVDTSDERAMKRRGLVRNVPPGLVVSDLPSLQHFINEALIGEMLRSATHPEQVTDR